MTTERRLPSNAECLDMVKPTLTDDLAKLLNKHCAENASNTPDYILAQYMMSCLSAFNTAVQQRETWYGRDARPTEVTDA
jgi:hypothetical protein